MNEIHLSDHVHDQIRRYEAGRIETEDFRRKDYARAKKRRREAIWIALVQIARSLFTLRLKKLIEGIQDFRDALDRPLPFKVTKLERGDNESRFISGLDGESRVLNKLRKLCRKPCTALLGYTGAKGEIDIIVVGRYGITAIEVKNTTGEICCNGDSWWRIKSGQSDMMQDAGGRSPSVQLKECASELQEILSRNGVLIPIRCVVVLAHRYAKYGIPFSPSVNWACKIEHLNSRVLFESVPDDTLDRDRIARVCEFITQAHEREAPRYAARAAEQQHLPLYEERYQNVAIPSWSLRNVSAPKLLLGGFLLFALIALGVTRFTKRDQQKPPAVPTQTAPATTPMVKRPRRSHHKAAIHANNAPMAGAEEPVTARAR